MQQMIDSTPGLYLYHLFVYTLCVVSGPHSVVLLSRVMKDELCQSATKEKFFDRAFFRQNGRKCKIVPQTVIISPLCICVLFSVRPSLFSSLQQSAEAQIMSESDLPLKKSSLIEHSLGNNAGNVG